MNKTNTNLRALFLIIFLNLLYWPVQAQNFNWAKGIGGVGDNRSVKISSDIFGNVYTLFSSFEDTVDFDPNIGVYNLYYSREISASANVVSKIDSSGNFVWAKHIVGRQYPLTGGNISSDAMMVDRLGNIYITGTFNSFNDTKIDFDAGPDTFYLSQNSGAQQDFFILKLDANGDFLWAINIGNSTNSIRTPSIVQGQQIDTDTLGNVYVSGFFGKSFGELDTVDFDPGPGVANLYSNGKKDVFILKVDSLGKFVWAKNFGDGSAYVNTLTVDIFGNVYTSGYFSDTVDLDPGSGIFNLRSKGLQDIFLSKLDSSGKFVWAKSFGGTGYDLGLSITTDLQGNVLASGYFQDTVVFGSDTFSGANMLYGDIFILKIDTSGKLIWAKMITVPLIGQPAEVKTDKYGGVYIIGSLFGTIDFDPGESVFSLTSIGAADAVIFKLNTTGDFQWAINLGSSNYEQGKSIFIDEKLNILATGYFNDSVDFDPGLDTFNLYSSGKEDVFILKWSQTCSNYSVLTLSTCDSIYLNGETFSASGQYMQTVTHPDACDTVYTINLTVHTSPGLAVSQSENELTAQATNCTYQWIDCGNGNRPIPGASQSKFIPSVNGSYAVVLTGSGGCSDTSACYPVQGLSVQHVGSENFISVYPNPSDGILKLTSTHTLNNASLRVSNLLGQTLLFQSKVDGSSLLIDISGYPSGIYNIEITEGDKSFRSKLVRE